ncbi:hypothetical protein [Lutimonas zeaxanthinifaciens]|uniref:hypothetical protein n=1 Tax=Lutimonas zeaxanthinifaciens TaxID=3060215 RepID=UPI00265D0C30|nr:hypothetical protein [Lutimonas sp. YSD2104]WKK67242.1 hypothetical protein QZH61_06360 [Lutimonas sp. YSD2104]
MFPDRFSLSLKPYIQEVSDPVEKINEVFISNNGNRFSVRSESKVKRFRMYDLLGRMLISYYPDDINFEVNDRKSKTGEILHIEMIHDDQAITRKKIYKR